jgi:hypothetical protein
MNNPLCFVGSIGDNLCQDYIQINKQYQSCIDNEHWYCLNNSNNCMYSKQLLCSTNEEEILKRQLSSYHFVGDEIKFIQKTCKTFMIVWDIYRDKRVELMDCITKNNSQFTHKININNVFCSTSEDYSYHQKRMNEPHVETKIINKPDYYANRIRTYFDIFGNHAYELFSNYPSLLEKTTRETYFNWLINK